MLDVTITLRSDYVRNRRRTGNVIAYAPRNGPALTCMAMILAYIDESGDGGFVGSPTDYFCLGCVLVDESQWLSSLDALIAFRRYLRDTYGLPMKAELKAQYLLRGHRSYGALTPQARMKIYAATMAYVASAGHFRVFAVVIRKPPILHRPPNVVLDRAWVYLLQRLQSWATSRDSLVQVMHDEGNSDSITRRLRAMRRHHWVPSFFVPGTSLRATAQRIIEDPTERESGSSYFIQLADLIAFAAARHEIPSSRFDGRYWRLTGPARIEEVSRLRGGPRGIVPWPT